MLKAGSDSPGQSDGRVVTIRRVTTLGDDEGVVGVEALGVVGVALLLLNMVIF